RDRRAGCGPGRRRRAAAAAGGGGGGGRSRNRGQQHPRYQNRGNRKWPCPQPRPCATLTCASSFTSAPGVTMIDAVVDFFLFGPGRAILPAFQGSFNLAYPPNAPFPEAA